QVRVARLRVRDLLRRRAGRSTAAATPTAAGGGAPASASASSAGGGCRASGRGAPGLVDGHNGVLPAAPVLLVPGDDLLAGLRRGDAEQLGELRDRTGGEP